MKSFLKKAARVIAFDDGYFVPGKNGTALLVGVVYSMGHRVEGLVSARVAVDGLDSAEKIIDSVSGSRFGEQASAVMLSGLNFAGFNIADIAKVREKLGIPVISVFRKMPDMGSIHRALSKFPDAKKRISLIKKAGRIHSCGKIFFQKKGISEKDAALLIKRCLLHSEMPEPLRLSHIIASGITQGESKR
jgi:endonuclease V-like protein UPF0215 family